MFLKKQVCAVIFAIGTNDIGMSRNPKKDTWVKAEMLIAAMTELVEKAKSSGVKVYGTTILPRGGVMGEMPEHDTELYKFNKWMRETDIFDQVFDFAYIVCDKKNPRIMGFENDSGDHLHPGRIGGEKMAKLLSDYFVTMENF